jgi:cyclohexadieny/prephenate dehydrogenase
MTAAGTTPAAAPAPALFRRAAIVGFGLIGSSLARAVRAEGIAGAVVCCDRSEAVRARVLELGLAEAAHADPAEAARGADLVVVCTPVGTYPEVADALAPGLAPGTVVTDVGSVKVAAVRDIGGRLPAHVRFVAGHPVAGTENSGPDAGFAELFRGRWAIVTPVEGSDPEAVELVSEMWRRCGSRIAEMDPAHHDKVLAITSHLPHLIAYTIVGTATDLEESTKSEVINFSASGFRDFTRIAASDPVMWRDIFLANREAVLEMTQRFTEDLTALQRAIRWGDGEALERLFTRTRAIRRSIVDARQA